MFRFHVNRRTAVIPIIVIHNTFVVFEFIPDDISTFSGNQSTRNSVKNEYLRAHTATFVYMYRVIHAFCTVTTAKNYVWGYKRIPLSPNKIILQNLLALFI